MTDAPPPHQPAPKPKLILFFMAIAAIALVTSTVAMFVVRSRPAPPQGPTVPAFALTDQNGDPVTETVLDGRITVLDFIFTSCPLYCPAMTDRMKIVQDATVGTGARFLSISIDGPQDTPERLTEWAESFGADTSRWTFATGPTELTWAIARSLGFEVAPDDSLDVQKPDGSIGVNLLHPTRLLLIDKKRRVVGMYAYDDPAKIDELIRRIRSGG